MRALIASFALISAVGCAAYHDGAYTVRDIVAFRGVVRQQFETTCGAASVATLLSYAFGHGTTEEQVLRLALPGGSIPERGLSLEDLKRAIGSSGFRAASFEMDLSVLMELPQPAIVVLCPTTKCPPDMYHFSVFERARSDEIHLADSSRGRMVLSRTAFARIWSGFVLVVGPREIRSD